MARLNIKISKELHKALKGKVVERETTIQGAVVEAVENWVRRV